MNKKYKIGLALSGGGIRGLAHAGALQALQEYQIIPNAISGVSAGAVVGALYADGYTPLEIRKMFHKMDIRKMTSLHLPNGGMFGMDNFEKFLASKLRAKTFSELRIPLKILATDFDKGEIHTFSKGNLLEAILASCSIPILFTPRKIRNTYYVDGGLLQNFPVSTLKKDCQMVIGVNVSPLSPTQYSMHIKDIAERTFHFLMRSNTLTDREICDHYIEPLDTHHFGMFDVDKSAEIYQLGYDCTRNYFKDLTTIFFDEID